ncbi:MAG: DNA-3-methyladenine glycosylase [Pseudomonadales bacterium]
MQPFTLSQEFFNQTPTDLAVALLGKVLRHRVESSTHGPMWLSARIIETEAYYLTERGSHSSLGYTEKRKAMFMAPGTIYMYYARGKDSLNFSAMGEGNGVLVKSGYPLVDDLSTRHSLRLMQQLNPGSKGSRTPEQLCCGQTLLCRSLNLKVTDWNQQEPDTNRFRVDDTGYRPEAYVQCQRIGIPEGRDEHLPYRFIDLEKVQHCTSNPLSKRNWREGVDYTIHRL